MPDEVTNATNLLTLWEFEGVLKFSPIFYGYYSNIERVQYKMPLAYFLTGLVVYIFSFVAILRKWVSILNSYCVGRYLHWEKYVNWSLCSFFSAYENALIINLLFLHLKQIPNLINLYIFTLGIFIKNRIINQGTC